MKDAITDSIVRLVVFCYTSESFGLQVLPIFLVATGSQYNRNESLKEAHHVDTGGPKGIAAVKPPLLRNSDYKLRTRQTGFKNPRPDLTWQVLSVEH